MISQLRQLCVLAELVRDVELSRLARAQSRYRALEQEHDDACRLRLSAQRAAAADPAHISGNATVWQSLMQARLTDRATRQAAAAAEVEAMRCSAARATGRSEVLKKLSAAGKG